MNGEQRAAIQAALEFLRTEDEQELKLQLRTALNSEPTLCDYFASRAMQGAIMSLSTYTDIDENQLANWAYGMADAMLKARMLGHE